MSLLEPVNGIRLNIDYLLKYPKNWRGRPLETYQIIVNLIASTKTSTGLKVNAAIDPNIYQTGIKVSKQEMENINLHRHEFHGENWNYTIKSNE